MQERRDPYFEKYDADFGLSGLTEKFADVAVLDGEEAALALVTAKIVEYEDETPVDMSRIERLGEDERRRLGFDVFHDDWGYAEELRADLRRLLESPLPDEVLRAVWLAATGNAWDPESHGIGIRDWLVRIDETCAAHPPRSMVGRKPSPSWQFWRLPVADAAVRDAILAEIRSSADELTAPGLVSALEEVVGRADLDLGFRFFLRALKTASVPVAEERFHRFCDLGEPFGYHIEVIHAGLTVVWRPLHVARRLFEGDFGFSELARQFDPVWERNIPTAELLGTTVAADGYRTPGVQALVLWEDTVRLLRSPLSTDTITTLWTAASNVHPDRFETGGRDWLRWIADACTARLREVAPSHRPALPSVRGDLPSVRASVCGDLPSVRGDLADAVLHELREAAPLLTDQDAVVLEQVVTQVDPGLGYRLLLRLLHSASGALTAEQYARCAAIGERFGYGEDLVSEAVEHLVPQD
ncbi:hypothetical protein [Streptomyces sp. NBC_00878]|uniref:hypothetical protein n=1 Tax=Streptomyces sp. NBC_00878 TaxID=2975854 RepID=UPI002250AE5D|nr:hypothetical protein [Streptomyces sp. NBC_00878]MCX4909717.1 hypothetical protein [Streptomyces sp. NBC_00878]